MRTSIPDSCSRPWSFPSQPCFSNWTGTLTKGYIESNVALDIDQQNQHSSFFCTPFSKSISLANFAMRIIDILTAFPAVFSLVSPLALLRSMTLRVRLWMVLEVLRTVQSKSSGNVHWAHSASGLVGRLSMQMIVNLWLDIKLILSFHCPFFRLSPVQIRSCTN